MLCSRGLRSSNRSKLQPEFLNQSAKTAVTMTYVRTDCLRSLLQVFVDMFRFRSRTRREYRRTIDQEKIVAKTFVKFLEDKNRKEDMFVHELREIYQGEFCPLYETLGVSFSKLLNTLTYHLNLCQQLQDRIVFGGGEAAALQLLTVDGSEDLDSSGDENDSVFTALTRGRYYCNVCKRSLGNQIAYSNHISGVKHRQQKILRKIRKSLEK